MTIILAHQSLGGDCCGCILAMYRGSGTASLICNECGEHIRSVPAESVERELASLAVSCGYLVFPCRYCGTLNICTEVAFTDALVCPRCGTGMVATPSNLK